jgi:hypothetical protein
VTLTIPDEVGPRYDAGLTHPTHGSMGLFIKPGTFRKDLQTQLRDEVIASASESIIDRDIAFWKRITQADWSQGEGQEYFDNPSRYDEARCLDVHTTGRLRMVPQPTLLRAKTAALNGRGGVHCKQHVFFPWVDGQYTYINNALISSLESTPAAAQIADIVSDGSTVYFCFAGSAGVYQTPGAVPAALLLYDVAGSVYGRMAYNQITKQLFAVTGPITGLCRLDLVNAGAASTTIYNFLTGRVDALEMHQGNLVIGWNDSSGVIPTTGYIGKSRLFKYDGTNVTPFADLPDGCMVVGMKSALGILFVMCVEDDVLNDDNSPPKAIHTVYFITSSAIGRLSDITDARSVGVGVGSVNLNGDLTQAVALGQGVFFPVSGHTWRYDTAVGGLSRSLGDVGVPAIAGFAAAYMQGLAYMSGGGLLALINGPGAAQGGVYNLNGTIFGITPSDELNVPACKLSSSRMDAGLPYVQKFWYGIEAIFDPLIAGDSIDMECSLDDGATWDPCPPSAALVAGQKQALFLVQEVSAHIRYRVHLNAGAASKGPVVHAISARYAVVNPNASIYRFTVMGYDKIVGRGNIEEMPGYGRDVLNYLDLIARGNELVTFYEPDDSSRTPRSCFVMQMSRPMANTGSGYDSRKKEGDVEVILWEAV